MELFYKFLKFATLGITTEVVFTAIAENINRVKKGEKWDWSLTGHTFIWMIPIYGLIAFVGPLVIDPMQSLNLFIRLFIYAVMILVVEYITGFILRKLTGRCPWHYSTGLHVHNLIRLDYTPLWMGFGFIVEYLYFHY